MNPLKIAAFVAFLFPVVVDQYSVNYSFLLLPVVSILLTRRVEMPSRVLGAAIALYIVIYLAGLLIDLIGGGGFAVRMTMSFVIFMGMFALVPVDVTQEDIGMFKIAVVSIAVVFSSQSVVSYAMAGGSSYGFGLKDVVGSQRFSFISLLGLGVLLYMPARRRVFQVVKAVAIFILLLGLLLTFARATIVALGAAAALYLVAAVARRRWLAPPLLMRRTGIVAAYVVALFVVAPVTFDYYGELLFSRYSALVPQVAEAAPVESIAPTEAGPDIFIREGSEGTRLAIWHSVLNHTLSNPWLGSGYLGSWTLKDVTTGSAHNQYIDVMMRTGILGFAAYMLVLVLVFRMLFRCDAGLFWGGVAILVYGLFHETFKESQGGFVLAFLVGLYASDWRARQARGRQLRLLGRPE